MSPTINDNNIFEFEHLKILNSHDREGIRYEGGIVRKENAMWYCNSRDEYQYRQGSTEGWKNMNDIFNR